MPHYNEQFLLDNFIISRETIKALKLYEQLVLKWNNKINLISASTISDFWNRHVVDSIQLLKYIEDLNYVLVDVGSGAGFPGLVLSICGVKNILLVESDSKKCAFLLQAAKFSNNDVNIINNRVENLDIIGNILVSRAWINLEEVFYKTQQLKINNKYLLLKGKDYQKEIQKAQQNWRFKCIVHDSITSTEGKILEISNIERIK